VEVGHPNIEFAAPTCQLEQLRVSFGMINGELMDLGHNLTCAVDTPQSTPLAPWTTTMPSSEALIKTHGRRSNALLPALLRIVELHRRRIEGLRVEAPPGPPKRRLVLLVVGIGDDLKKLRIAVDTTTV